MSSLKIFNPADDSLITEMIADTPESISEKFYEARRAQFNWAHQSIEHRKTIITKFLKLLETHQEELAQSQSLETGKPITQARNEIKATLPRIQYFIDHVDDALKTQDLSADLGSENEILKFEPLGIIANISAWNYPYFVGTNVFIPALLAGNAVLYKPSEFATLTGLHISDLMNKAGLPPGLFQPIIGAGEVGAELLKLPIQGVFFTGSHSTGVKIAESVASKLIKVQLELGGKDPSYVCEDTDIPSTAEALADGAFYNAGQSCCSVERIYVHEKIYDDFIKKFVSTVKDFKIGPPSEDSTYIGPLTRKPQIEILNQQIEEALNNGAELKLGGKAMDGPGNYFEPTILTQVTSDMLVMNEESFGPIIGIEKVSSDEAAIQLMNSTEYGLTSGVYTNSKERAEKILSKMQSGTVYWNCCDRVSPRLPWTGRKNSGIGSTLSHMGIQAFTQPKAFHKR